MEIKTQFILEVEPEALDISPDLAIAIDPTIENKPIKVRLDKWLWAARFFKTRALARSAIECGKVYYEGQKTNPCKEINIGATIEIQQGKSKKVIIVRELSTRRRNTHEAHTLFEETSRKEIVHNIDVLEQIQTDKTSKVTTFVPKTIELGKTDPQTE